MAKFGKFPFIKPNFKKIPQFSEDASKCDEEDVREIIVERKVGFNTVEVLIVIIVSIIFGVVIGTSVSFFRHEYKGEKISSSLQELITVYNDILDNYYDDVDEGDLVDAAVKGMMSSLGDPFSTYMDEDKAVSFNESVDGSYQGIGVTMTVDEDNQFLVLAVSAGSPAAKAGIQEGDILLKIDGKSLDGKSLDEVSNMVKEANSKTLKLTFIRDNQEITKKISLDTIDLVSVTSKVYSLNNGNTGYIYIDNFAANTYKQFKDELEKVEKKNIQSLIIDIRSNPGGHVSQAKKILELFMKKGKVLYQVQTKEDVSKIKDSTKTSRTYPVVLLTNSTSASAAEILAASFKDSYSDATLIGDTTYGKGTIQTAYSLSDGTSVKYTTEKWLTPKGKSINKKGITPDKTVLLTTEYYTNPCEDNDLQLQTALDFLETERNTSEN